jgi:hypothetical protein
VQGLRRNIIAAAYRNLAEAPRSTLRVPTQGRTGNWLLGTVIGRLSRTVCPTYNDVFFSKHEYTRGWQSGIIHQLAKQLGLLGW